MGVAWHATKRVVELLILAVCLFQIPETRLEHLLVIGVALVWATVRAQQIASENQQRMRAKGLLQMLRAVFAHLERNNSADSDADFEWLQDHVGIGNSNVLSAKYAYLRKPVSVAAMRAEIEQTWFDSIVRVHSAPYYLYVEGIAGWFRFGLVAWAFWQL